MTRSSRSGSFGLTGAEANHGEDVKEYWWYLDAVPSHAWNSWRYHYPQRAYPYQQLLDENRRRGKLDPEYELLDTGIFDDDRYWVVDVQYAKADPTDILMTISVTNAGPDTELLHLLPTVWYRNTWSWDAEGHPTDDRRHIDRDVAGVDHPFLGQLELLRRTGPTGRLSQSCCSVTTRRILAALWSSVILTMAEGRNQRPRRLGCRHRQSGATRHQVRSLVSA